MAIRYSPWSPLTGLKQYIRRKIIDAERAAWASDKILEATIVDLSTCLIEWSRFVIT